MQGNWESRLVFLDAICVLEQIQKNLLMTRYVDKELPLQSKQLAIY